MTASPTLRRFGFGMLRTVVARGTAGVPAAPKQRCRALSTLSTRPRALIVCGPSGVGKGTIIEELKKTAPEAFGFSVSLTTRGPRPGELDGVHYHFVGADEMTRRIAAGQMIEHAHVHGNTYGTSFAAVDEVAAQGKICILDIDVQGCRQCRSSGVDGIYVFVSPPSMELLESRLRGRGTETEEKILMRLGNARAEVKASNEEGLFDFKIVNDAVHRAVEELGVILRDEVAAAVAYQSSMRPK